MQMKRLIFMTKSGEGTDSGFDQSSSTALRRVGPGLKSRTDLCK